MYGTCEKKDNCAFIHLTNKGIGPINPKIIKKNKENKQFIKNVAIRIKTIIHKCKII